jgi:hypothetical protein
MAHGKGEAAGRVDGAARRAIGAEQAQFEPIRASHLRPLALYNVVRHGAPRSPQLKEHDNRGYHSGDDRYRPS